MDEGRRIERVVGAFAGQACVRQLPELLVDQRQQPVERLLVAVAPVKEQLGNGNVGRVRHGRQALNLRRPRDALLKDILRYQL